MSLVCRFVCWYISNHMGHTHAVSRDAIFRAISNGVFSEFYEDNFYTRLNFMVLQLTKNMPGAVDGVRHMGKRVHYDAHSAAQCAANGVKEAMRDVPIPEWRQKELAKG